MNELVFIEKGQVVTDSLRVAGSFKKEHKRVMQDIRDLGCSEEFRQHNFVLSSYVNSQNKELPMYYLNKKGFALLAMGYTGKEAMKFKEEYINEFERMEDELKKPRALSEREQLLASMKLTIEIAEDVTSIKTEMDNMKNEVKEIRSIQENQITIESGEQRRVQIAIAQRVYELEGNKFLRTAKFAELHREIRNRFGVATYKDIRKKDLQAALSYIEAWVPRRVS